MLNTNMAYAVNNDMNDAMDIEDNNMINMLNTNMAYAVNNDMNDAMDIEDNNMINMLNTNMAYAVNNDMNFNEEDMNYIQDSSTASGNWYYNYSLSHNNNMMELETPDFIPFEPGAIPFETERIDIATVLEQFQVSQEDRCCCVCMETNMSQTDICKLNCGHKYCNNCMIQHINAHRNASLCPLCRGKISTVTVNSNDGQILFTFA